ncbi:MAG: PEP-CTERM sorting domain-containing protein [Bryobacteraceae bacterium]
MTHKFTTLILAVSALGLSALPAAADNACSTYAGSDNGGTYFGTGGFSCFIGNLDFSNFTYSSSASAPPVPTPAADVTVNTVDNASGIGFLFTSSWTAPGPNEFTDAFIGFTVSVIGGGSATLEDAALVQTGSIDKTNSGSLASVGEGGCAASTIEACGDTPDWTLVTSESSNSATFADHTFYAPTGVVSVSKDINVVSGSNANAFASISGVEDTFSQVPEPRSLALLLGLGLVAGLSLKKKLQSVKS